MDSQLLRASSRKGCILIVVSVWTTTADVNQDYSCVKRELLLGDERRGAASTGRKDMPLGPVGSREGAPADPSYERVRHVDTEIAMWRQGARQR